MTESEQI